ncbi:MAG: tetraacyldisaccharide 4'-kinase [Gallionellaceae bacterium]|jgi:tetraacyldisaccharide 4'-kinase
MRGIEQYWYRLSILHLLLWPLSLLLRVLVALRYELFRGGILCSVKLPVPVVVVGNISVGGTGKTPFTLWLAQQLLDEGWHPAIISRGYTPANQTHSNASRAVQSNDSPDEVGDEPLLMVQRNLCPVWIGRDRPAVAQAVLQAHPECDVILSDDGLQHYRLQRDVEIVLIDGQRRFGNGLLLPAGPLREPVSRLKSVDFIVLNGEVGSEDEFTMRLDGTHFYNLLNPERIVSAGDFAGQRIHALAGIGHPARFFLHLEKLGLQVQAHAFPDHYAYTSSDIEFDDADALLMTEKDAVKCAAFATEQCWVLRVDAQINPVLAQLIIEKIKK